LTLSDDYEPSKQKNKQKNMAQAVDALQPATIFDLKPLSKVQLLQTYQFRARST